MNNIDNLIKNLNKEQKEAVLSTEGPNLIVAGAGSGKTRVLTTRLIHIINQKKAFSNRLPSSSVSSDSSASSKSLQVGCK